MTERKGKNEKVKRKRSVRDYFSFEIIIDGKYSVVRRKRNEGKEHRRRGLFFLYNRCKDANVQTFTEKNESELDKRDITKIKK